MPGGNSIVQGCYGVTGTSDLTWNPKRRRTETAELSYPLTQRRIDKVPAVDVEKIEEERTEWNGCPKYLDLVPTRHATTSLLKRAGATIRTQRDHLAVKDQLLRRKLQGGF